MDLQHASMAERLAFAERHARQVYEQQPELLPFLHMFGPDSRVVAPFMWDSGHQRALLLAFVRQKLDEHQATGYLVVSEIWMAAQPVDAPVEGQAGFVMPAERADRREALFIGAVERGGKRECALFELKRDAAGMVRAMVPLDASGYTSMTFLQLFEPGDVAGRA